MVLTYLFCQLMCRQVCSWWQWWREKAPNFLSVVWHGEAFHRLGVQDVVSLILVDALFPLGGGRRREGKKKEKEKENHHWGGEFPWGWIHLVDCAVVLSC
jgi:hypothetical protein